MRSRLQSRIDQLQICWIAVVHFWKCHQSHVGFATAATRSVRQHRKTELGAHLQCSQSGLYFLNPFVRRALFIEENKVRCITWCEWKDRFGRTSDIFVIRFDKLCRASSSSFRSFDKFDFKPFNSDLLRQRRHNRCATGEKYVLPVRHHVQV